VALRIAIARYHSEPCIKIGYRTVQRAMERLKIA
jgi:hypothetical protein